MIRCVVIGCGWAGRHHLNTLKSRSDVVLAGAVEPLKSRQDEIADTYGIPVFSDVDMLLKSIPDIDLAVVATIPGLHREICTAVMEAGIDIYCEKPVCRSSEEILLLEEIANRKGVCFGVAFNQRYGDAVLKAQEILSHNSVKFHLVTASMYQQLPVNLSDNIREDFMLTDAVCHLLDAVTFLCGPVKAVKAFANKLQSELYSDVGAVLLFENGAIGTVSHSSVGGALDTQHPFQCIDIHTDEFRMCIDNQFDRLTVYPHTRKERLVYETSVFRRRDYVISMERALGAYLEAVKNGDEPPCGLAAALVNMQVIEEMKLSIQGK